MSESYARRSITTQQAVSCCDGEQSFTGGLYVCHLNKEFYLPPPVHTPGSASNLYRVAYMVYHLVPAAARTGVSRAWNLSKVLLFACLGSERDFFSSFFFL